MTLVEEVGEEKHFMAKGKAGAIIKKRKGVLRCGWRSLGRWAGSTRCNFPSKQSPKGGSIQIRVAENGQSS